MGWVVIVIIVAIFGNFYLFSGYAVKGAIAELVVGIALLADLAIIVFIVFMIYQTFKEKTAAYKREKYNKKKNNIENKISECRREIVILQNELKNTDATLNLISLISLCGGNTNSLEADNRLLIAQEINSKIKNKYREISDLEFPLKQIEL